jgi:peptidyl-tRNA hydrolase, PTH1 family
VKLVIGLGNIGREYKLTRHNIGFMCLDKFAAKHQLSKKTTRLYSYYRYEDCLLIMPKTYMNLSGEAYASALSKHGPFKEVLVVLDDIELPLGTVRIRTSGSNGGHNGLKSVIEKRGNSDFPRIRVGIGRSKTVTPRYYVLDNFTSEESLVINDILILIADWLDLYIKNDMPLLLDEYSKWKAKPIPPSLDGINRPKEEQ